MKKFSSLSDIRTEIDRIDDELLRLLTARAECSLQVADIKRGTDGEAVSFYRPEREAQILRRMREKNVGPLTDDTVIRFFREIISASLALEEPLTVAYLGPEGTFTHAAAVKHFGSAVDTLPQTGIDDIFRAVEAGRARFGVVPIENSTEGIINHTVDTLTESSLRICGECRLRIEHNLLGTQQDLGKIISVHAHPQALAQCRRWLDRHLPNVQRVGESSNAAAAELVVGNPTAAAIAGCAAAELYGLRVLEKNIEDVANNTTRFFVVGDFDVPPSGNDCTSLLVSVPHKPGGLRRLLEPFETAGVSLTRIDSRPSRTSLWNYNFFIDVVGHQNDDRLRPVLAALTEQTHLMRVLGSYPAAL